MYVLVREYDTNYGGSGEMTDNYDTLHEMAEAALRVGLGNVVAAYKVSESYLFRELQDVVADRERQRTAAVEKARSKLTQEELELLGIA